MKPVVTDKLLMSLLGVNERTNATALFFSVLVNLDGEGCQIDYERILTAINIRFHAKTKQKR